MKNETARREIESLDYYLQNHTDDYSEESHTAMMMAIKALEQQPSEDCISREAVLNGLANIAKAKAKSDAQKALMGRVMYFIEQLPSVTLQASEEDIHREREQAYMLGYEDASKKFRTQPSEDAVSRSELMKLYKEWQPRLATNVCEFEQALENLPPATPERPKGKWIWDLRMGLHKCSVCSKFCDFDYLYCPNCGSYNGGGEDEVSD